MPISGYGQVKIQCEEIIRKYVEDGGSLYASVASDGAIPDMASLFGARLVDRVPSSELTLKFVAPFGDFKPGETLHYIVPSATTESWGTLLEVTAGKIIAVDQDGHPALVANTLGSVGIGLEPGHLVAHAIDGVDELGDQDADAAGDEQEENERPCERPDPLSHACAFSRRTLALAMPTAVSIG